MPSERPYFNFSVADLSALAEDIGQNSDALQAICSELSHRKTQAAVNLKSRVEGQLRTRAKEDRHARQESGKHTDRDDSKKLIEELQAELTAARNRIQALQTQLQGALDTLKMNEADSERSRLWLEQFRRYDKYGPEIFATFAKVCLTPDCPDVIVHAVRKAYRKENHPDAKPERERTAADENFKRIDAVFDEIEKHRKEPGRK